MLEPVQMETQIAETCMVEDDFFYSCLVQSTYYWKAISPLPPGLKVF